MGIGRIQAKREAAGKARRMALELAQSEDRQRVLAYAAELDEQADELERQLAAAPPSRTEIQMQTQQQQAPEEPDDDPGARKP
jgi:hypothetical protein